MPSTPQKRRLLRQNHKRRLLAGEPPRRPGENTSEGRKAAQLALTTNGVRSSIPILPGIEKPQEWQTFLEGFRAVFMPVGALEDQLVHWIALALWRRHRLTRHETALVLENTKQRVNPRMRAELETVLEQSRTQIEAQEAKGRAELRRLEALVNGSPKLLFSSDEAEALLAGFAGRFENLDDECDEDEDEEEEDRSSISANGNGQLAIEARNYSAAELVAELQSAADACGVDWCEHWEGYLVERRAAFVQWQANIEEARQQIALHLVPDETNLARLCDYERHLSCEVRKLLSVLERQQALRKGQLVVPPLAVDVQVSSVQPLTP
jgi:hypothetical protein